MKTYLELAIKQFHTMKEEFLNNDRDCVGGEDKKDYERHGIKFQLKIEGFWEKQDWFDYTVNDINGNEIESGDWY